MKKTLLGAVITIVTGAVLMATGWNFKATAEMPEKYVLKVEYEGDKDDNRDAHHRIEQKIDRILMLLLKQKENE